MYEEIHQTVPTKQFLEENFENKTPKLLKYFFVLLGYTYNYNSP